MLVLLPALRTVVNVPPTNTRLPITRSAFTRPFWMFGVPLAGVSLAIDPWATFTAPAGSIDAATRAPAATVAAASLRLARSVPAHGGVLSVREIGVARTLPDEPIP